MVKSILWFALHLRVSKNKTIAITCQWRQKYSLNDAWSKKSGLHNEIPITPAVRDWRVRSTLRIHSRIYPASLATRELNLSQLSPHSRDALRAVIYGKLRWGNFGLLKFLRVFCSIVDQGGRLATTDCPLSEYIRRET